MQKQDNSVRTTFLAAPSVNEADDNNHVAATVTAVTVVVPAWSGIAAGDRVDLLWAGDATGDYTDYVPVTAAMVSEKVSPTFSVPATEIATNHEAAISYVVTPAAGDDKESSDVYTLSIGEVELLPAPAVDEADGTVINVDDNPDGVTAVVPAEANLEAGDVVTLFWTGTDGAGTTSLTETVSGNGAGKLLTFHIGADVLAADAGTSIQIYYTVEQASGSKGTSAIASYDIETTGEDISDIIPVALEATGNNGTLLTEDDYYRLENLTIEIPVYKGMTSGDTVTVYWDGRDYDYQSEALEVTTVAPLDFSIPRVEFIDTIGYTADVYCTVKKKTSGETYQSGTLKLEVEGQSRDLKAPDVSDDLTEVTVIYTGMTTNDMINIRVTGKVINESDTEEGNSSNRLVFEIDKSWLTPDDNGMIMYDYAVGISGGKYQFSRVTRKKA